MSNVWIVVPITSNDLDLSVFVEKMCGSYTAPEFYEKVSFNDVSGEKETELINHPYFGQTGPDFTDKIIFVNMIDQYTEYQGVVHLESFGEINIPRLMNVGIDYAVANGAEKILVLSNPCNFDLFIINEAITNNLDKDIINISDGAAFILSSASGLRLNEDLRIWYWPEDLYNSAKESMGMYRSDFIDFTELIPLYVNNEILSQIVKEDEVIFNSKWI